MARGYEAPGPAHRLDRLVIGRGGARREHLRRLKGGPFNDDVTTRKPGRNGARPGIPTDLNMLGERVELHPSDWRQFGDPLEFAPQIIHLDS